LSSAFTELVDSDQALNKKKSLRMLDSINTIYELSNEEYSRGGYSSSTKKLQTKLEDRKDIPPI